MILSRSPGHLGPSVGGLGGGDMLEGEWQGAQGAAPSAASLVPPWSLPAPFRTQREGLDVHTVFLGQLYNHCLPRPARRGRGGGRGA